MSRQFGSLQGPVSAALVLSSLLSALTTPIILTLSICALKLAVLPAVVWGLAIALKLPPLETQVVVLQSSIAIGVNVYLMARQFNSLQGPIASALIISSVLSAFTTPIAMTIMASIA